MTESTWREIATFGVGLFALINPFTKLSYVLSIATNAGSRAVTSMAVSATLTMLTTLLVMHFIGEPFLIILGTSLPSFQIGGGLIILLTGLSMLREPAAGVNSAQSDSVVKHDLGHFMRLGVAPLGIPMLAGAGAMTKVVMETHPGHGLDNDMIVTAVIIMVCLISGTILAAGSVLMRLLGPAFFSVMARIAGLVIVAVAVEVMVKGIFTHAKLFMK